jgi:hypothetical protein
MASKPSDTKRDAAIGLWQLRATETVEDDVSGRLTNDAYIFRYDGDTVTLRLITTNPAMWKSDDDFYRLATRWDGDMLTYRPPFTDWTELASFDGDHFEDVGSGTRRIFGRISDDEVADWNRAILTPREPHDYSIQPRDPSWSPPEG